MMTTKSTDQLQQEIQQLWNCYNAMSLPFGEFSASINRAEGAITVSENFCPSVYLDKAKENLSRIERIIQNYRQNLPQDYERLN